MSLYTKYGDKGFTFTKLSVKTPKNHALVNFLGNLDELNCFVGSLAAQISTPADKDFYDIVTKIMSVNFEIGAFLGYGTPLCFENLNSFIKVIEQQIDDQESKNNPLSNFILPTGSERSCAAHVCRSVARRAERSIYEMEIMAEAELVIQFLNRISDYFFSLARTLNRLDGQAEIIWRSSK